MMAVATQKPLVANPPSPECLQGPVPAWGRWRTALLVALMLLGLWLRLRGLSAEGFADDEIHKWLAVNRYLRGDFGGDDIEHPMLMKLLIAGCLLIGRHLGWAPETITRLPNVLFGALTIWVTAALGRRLFGRSVGLIAAGLARLRDDLDRVSANCQGRHPARLVPDVDAALPLRGQGRGR